MPLGNKRSSHHAKDLRQQGTKARPSQNRILSAALLLQNLHLTVSAGSSTFKQQVLKPTSTQLPLPGLLFLKLLLCASTTGFHPSYSTIIKKPQKAGRGKTRSGLQRSEESVLHQLSIPRGALESSPPPLFPIHTETKSGAAKTLQSKTVWPTSQSPYMPRTQPISAWSQLLG